jgi:hypothetical protein
MFTVGLKFFHLHFSGTFPRRGQIKNSLIEMVSSKVTQQMKTAVLGVYEKYKRRDELGLSDISEL